MDVTCIIELILILSVFSVFEKTYRNSMVTVIHDQKVLYLRMFFISSFKKSGGCMKLQTELLPFINIRNEKQSDQIISS